MKRLLKFFYALIILAAPLQATEYTPKNTIFVWDIHGVILKNDLVEIAKLLPQLIWHHPAFSFKEAAAFFKQGSGSKSALQDARAKKDEQLINLLMKLGNAQKKIAGTPQVIAAVKSLGFKNYIASNIDTAMFAQLINPAIKPEMAPLFLTNFDIPKSQTVDYGDNMQGVIHKPNPAYYEQFIKRNHINLKKTHVIFIDDTRANIEPARVAGFITIHFTNAKQLIEKLNCMGIAVSIVPTQASIAAPV